MLNGLSLHNIDIYCIWKALQIPRIYIKRRQTSSLVLLDKKRTKIIYIFTGRGLQVIVFEKLWKSLTNCKKTFLADIFRDVTFLKHKNIYIYMANERRDQKYSFDIYFNMFCQWQMLQNLSRKKIVTHFYQFLHPFNSKWPYFWILKFFI